MGSTIAAVLLVSIVCAAGQSPPSTLPLVCPPPPPPSLPVNPPWCPPLGGMNTVLAANTSHSLVTWDPALGEFVATQPENIYELSSGCPIAFRLDYGENIYLKIKRDVSGSRLKFTWDYKSQQRAMPLFSWDFVPYYIPNQAFTFQDYSWTGGLDDSTIYNKDETSFQDLYHYGKGFSRRRGPYCGAGAPISQPLNCTGADDIDENTGYLYITLAAYFNEQPGDVVHGYINFEFLKPNNDYIKPEQLQALKDIYHTNCMPTQVNLPVFDPTAPDNSVNSYWTIERHQRGRYSTIQTDPQFSYRHIFNTSGYERDSDQIPFCDWMFVAPSNSSYSFTDPTEALTEDSCEDMQGIVCDSKGNVVEINLELKGLSGPLPASFKNLTGLKLVYLNSNKLSGNVDHLGLFASPLLERLSLTHNFFTGPIPCPEHNEYNLARLFLSQNHFSGGLPSCLFTMLPKLTTLYVSYLDLNTTIPPEIGEAGELQYFSAAHAGLHGDIPLEMQCNAKLSTLSMPRNQLSGGFPQVVFDKLTSLYRLNIQSNSFTGPLPHISKDHYDLRYLYLDHNLFSGGIAEQLTDFANAQESTSGSAVSLDHNALSGPLPPVFKKLVDNAHYIQTLSAEENHFLCAPGTDDWPGWVFRMGSSFFGKCKKVARPMSILDTPYPGKTVRVEGTDFVANPELKCKIGDVETKAYAESSTMVVCEIPENATLASTEILTVANYGSDFYSLETFGSGYTMMMVEIPNSPPPPSPPPPYAPATLALVSPNDDDDVGLIIGLTVGLGILGILICVGCFFVYKREKAGKPIFQPMASTIAVPAASITVTAVTRTSSTTAASVAEVSAEGTNLGEVSLEMETKI